MYLHDCSIREGMKSLLFHAIFCIPMHIVLHASSWSWPHIVAVLKGKNCRILKGLLAISTLVLNASHNHIFLMWGSPGVSFENSCWALVCKVYGNKIDDTAFLFVHEMLSYLLYCSINFVMFINIKPCSPPGSFLNEVRMDILECGILSH